MKFECWEEGGGKAGQRPKKKENGKGKEKEASGSKETTTTASVAKEEDAAWMAMTAFPIHEEFTVMESSSCPTLEELLGTEEVSEETENELLEGVEAGKEEKVPTVIDIGIEAHTTTYDSAALTREGLGNTIIDIELYDSGASRHITGYRHRLSKFVEIEAKPITAADKRTFNATGRGNMYVDVPNGKGTSKVLLRDVLYSPSMNITLVSIGGITSSGSSVLFHGNVCRIFDQSKTLIAEIPKQNGLY